MSLPTITGVPPETWEQILQILNQLGVTVLDLAQQGITTYEGAGGLKEYLTNNGWELKEVWELKQMWFHTGAGDVTQTNALTQYMANKLTVAGTAGSEYVKHFTYGETTLGKLKKGIIFGSIFALLISTLDPNLITDTLKGRLNAVIDRFADENDDVPVILDGNGKIYYHEDMINALRQELIDAGVYDTGSPTYPIYDRGATLTYQGSTSTVTKNQLNECQMLSKIMRSYNGSPVPLAYVDFRKQDPVTSEYITVLRLSAEQCQFCMEGSSSSGSVYVVNIFDEPFEYEATAFVYSDGYESVSYSTLHNTPPITVGYNGETYSGYVADTLFSSFGPLSVQATLDANGYTSFVSSSHTVGWVKYSTRIGGSGGVEGITVSDDLISRGIGNAQTALEDIFPSYATDKVTTINPSDEDITASDNWYPISTEDSDVWTDGITEQQSETATDGEVTPDIQAQIADAIKQILEDYYRDPDDPNIINYPEIPVGDSGDTPPANPELLSGSSNGLWAIYNPSKSEVQQFGAWLWSNTILDQITRMFNSPIDAVIGFHMIYCTPITGASKTIKAGYLDSPVSAPEVTDQYKDIDCGTIAIPEYYRNALDYDNTRISLFLPFIGIVPLDTAQVMGSSLSILYRIDVLTGTCLAQVSVIKENSNAVMYTYQGNCSVQIPLTATTYTGMVGALLSGISAGASIMTGNIIGAVSAGIEGAMRAGTGLTGVRQSGTLGANAGALGIRIPYVIITHPVSVMPDDFNSLEGLPSAELVPLSSVSGFTRVTYVHLENIPATAQEVEEITTLLQAGVIF